MVAEIGVQDAQDPHFDVYSVWRNVDHVPGLPLKFFDLVLPVVGIRYFHIAILVEVVTVSLENIETLLGEVSVFTGSTSGGMICM